MAKIVTNQKAKTAKGRAIPREMQAARIVGSEHYPTGLVHIWVDQPLTVTEAEYHAIVALRRWEAAARVPSDRALYQTIEAIERGVRMASERDLAEFDAFAMENGLTVQEAHAFKVLAGFRDRTVKARAKAILAASDAKEKESNEAAK